MKNHELHLTSSQAFSESECKTNIGCNWRGKRGRGYCNHGGHKQLGQRNNRDGCHQKWNVFEKHSKENGAERKKEMLDMITKKFVPNVEEKVIDHTPAVQTNIW